MSSPVLQRALSASQHFSNKPCLDHHHDESPRRHTDSEMEASTTASSFGMAAAENGFSANLFGGTSDIFSDDVEERGPSKRSLPPTSLPLHRTTGDHLNGAAHDMDALALDNLPSSMRADTLQPMDDAEIDPRFRLMPDAFEEATKTYEHIDECVFRGGAKGRAEGMLGSESFPCQCQYEPDVDDREVACGEDSNCVNRHLYIECNQEDCPCGVYCLNRRFQQHQYAPVHVIKTEKKGFGLQALEGLEANQFVMEYVGEVLPQSWFVKRARQYAQEGIAHHYFMTLNSEEYIDATKKGCLARFINHSCNPNSVLQKWTVGARMRMGIFTLRRVAQGEELTFDYKFERYGAEAQPCYCGEPNCKGYIGGDSKSNQKAMDIDFAFLESAAVEEEAKPTRGRGRRARAEHDGDHRGGGGDDEYVEEHAEATDKPKQRGLQTLEHVEKFVQLMMKYAKNLEYSRKLLLFLDITESQQLLRKFMNTHGLQVLKIYLAEYDRNDELCRLILQQIDRLPITTRNTINASGVDHVVEKFTTHEDPEIAQMATQLIEAWKDLKVVYKIPKRIRQSRRSSSPESMSASRIHLTGTMTTTIIVGALRNTINTSTSTNIIRRLVVITIDHGHAAATIIAATALEPLYTASAVSW
ncbi:hypothetical protein THASP1DRAFT_32709 [Thamnocephalis sphaerospora]|uniref:Uncharacterized protein n=1 Tax=Thamnocephalis sphaerospora TaxID=78915 RepID=A0A4P9XID5_9FUNG|nr:hypothetical protein THASP1DRAFT_32709 [Thamnocephalis sphaerospora]|eukprot:RKP05448.1 hypothetical protein THASP1DRAFT_32709 [Thamnocephalis sphaerospora]